MKYNRIFLTVFLLLISSIAIHAQIIEIEAKLIKEYLLPNGYENKGLLIHVFPPPPDYPKAWNIINGRHYIMSGWELYTNVFDSNFEYIQSIFPESQYYFWFPKEISLTVLGNMDVLIPHKGVVTKKSPRNIKLTEYDLTEYLIKDYNEYNSSEDIPFYKFYHVIIPNGNDGLILDPRTGKLQYLLHENGDIITDETALRKYIENTFRSLKWTNYNKGLADRILKRNEAYNGFLGKNKITSMINHIIVEELVKHYQQRKIELPVSDFGKFFHLTENGFWVRSKSDANKEYYFDLINNKVYVIKNLIHFPTIFWFEERYRVYKIGYAENEPKIKISEYSLDFLK